MSRFIISGGGTGGHIYPAIAIAQAIRRREPAADILFIGARGKLEMDLVPKAGFCIEGLPVAGFIRRFSWKNITFPLKLGRSLWLARSIVRQFRPEMAIGVGGYASGPTLRVAASMGIPILIQEQNSFPGVTNRMLGKKATTICVAYEGMDRFFPAGKIVLTGNPVRSDLISLPDHPAEAYAHFGLDPARKTILVMGGSGGARTINESMLALLEKGLPDGVQVLWQTGTYYYEEVKRRLTDAQYEIRDTGDANSGSRMRDDASTAPASGIVPFIDRMDLAYAVADLVISRAGAITISELCVAGKPVILVPSPNVADDHQMKNAKALADRGAAMLVADREAVGLLPDRVIQLIQNDTVRSGLAERIRQLAITDAADRIAGEAFKPIQTGRRQHG